MEEQEHSTEIRCKRCSKVIEGNGWRDGKSYYCDFRCFAAKKRRSLLMIAIIFTPLIIATFLLSRSDYFLSANSEIEQIIYFFVIIAGAITVLGMYYAAYVGWSVIRDEEGSV